MQDVNEIHVVYMDEIQVYETSEGFSLTEEAQEKMDDVFRRVEIFLEDMGITPEIAFIERSACELDIVLDSDPIGFSKKNRLLMLQKLEAFFDVIIYHVETDYDVEAESGPRVVYGIVDRID